MLLASNGLMICNASCACSDDFLRHLKVCDELGLPSQEVDDVTAVIASMRADCTIADGEAAPRNPGKPAPKGKSLYARLGGVYPIALFADRLVDALLSDRTVRIPLGTSGRTVRLQLT